MCMHKLVQVCRDLRLYAGTRRCAALQPQANACSPLRWVNVVARNVAAWDFLVSVGVAVSLRLKPLLLSAETLFVCVTPPIGTG